MKTTILLAAMTMVVAAGPAMARPAAPASYGQSIYCATREAGNPHSRLCDYIAWSGWRRRGGWDSSLDNACLMNPRFVPSECGGSQFPSSF
jgi:hypothetical protein